MTIPTEQLLNIPNIHVLKVELNQHEIACDIESTQNYSICHRCKQKATAFHERGETIQLRHSPICDRRVRLFLHTKRFSCLSCKAGGKRVTTTESNAWYDAKSHCTKAFADFLLLELVGSTISDVGLKHRVKYDIIRGLLNRCVRGEVDWSQIESLRAIGLDEISLLKGHRHFVTIVSTRDEQGKPAILAVLKGREKKTVVDFLKTIPEEKRATIEQVCTDLYEGFISAVEEVLPQAKIVADRFHVAKLYRAALDELRKSEMKEIKRLLEKEEYAGLKGALWALRKNSDDLEPEEQETLDLLFECSPLLRKAYQLREKLTKIFDAKHSKQSGEQAIRKWMKEVKQSGLDCFDKFLVTLEERMDLITNYFISRLSSGWVEGLNNKIKVIKRRCYGIKDRIALFRRIWLDLNGYKAFAH